MNSASQVVLVSKSIKTMTLLDVKQEIENKITDKRWIRENVKGNAGQFYWAISVPVKLKSRDRESIKKYFAQKGWVDLELLQITNHTVFRFRQSDKNTVH